LLFALSECRRRTTQYDRERKQNAVRISSHCETLPVSLFSLRMSAV
jgi:hypothetical protein